MPAQFWCQQVEPSTGKLSDELKKVGAVTLDAELQGDGFLS